MGLTDTIFYMAEHISRQGHFLFIYPKMFQKCPFGIFRYKVIDQQLLVEGVMLVGKSQKGKCLNDFADNEADVLHETSGKH